MGEELIGSTPAEIARLGLGYVPQGRRLWPSVTVDEHLRLAGGNGRGQWTISRIYDTFPRLAERRKQSRQSAFRRRAADAGDFARAAAQSAPSHHGRADRGPCARDRRAGRANPAQSRRGKRYRRACRRAKYRRRHRRGRKSRDHDQRPGQPVDGGGAARSRSRTAAKIARRRPAWPGRAGRGSRSRSARPAGRAAAGEAARPDPGLQRQPDLADALVAAGAGGANRSGRAHAHARRPSPPRRRLLQPWISVRSIAAASRR